MPMITGSAITLDSAADNPLNDTISWQEELAASIRDPQELIHLLELDESLLENALNAHRDFALRVPRPYLERIRKGDMNDPLLRQVLPLGDELSAAPGYSTDPLQKNTANPTPGLIHKYHGRVLLIVSPSCAINCRYCFRRHFPYHDNKPGRHEWQRALDYIASNNTVSEVIYSGGDPLASSDKQLLWLTRRIADIPHVKRLRVHTRLPIVIPARITEQCINWLSDTRLQTTMVIHSNHPNELDEAVEKALKNLRRVGVTLLNQAVLLKGINDDGATLVRLSERLFEVGVLPYYLHLLDKVSGAAHFEVDENHAVSLRDVMLAQLPGYLVPRLVREIPGQPHKTTVV